MISASDVLLLNGVNEPGRPHTWIVGENLVEIDDEIKRLRRKHLRPREIAAALRVPPHRVAHRICQMIKRGEVRSQNRGGWRRRENIRMEGNK